MKSVRARSWLGAVMMVAAIGLLPLLGAVWAERDIERIFTFPPRLEISLEFATFSWWAAGAVVLLVFGMGVLWWAGRRAVGVAADGEKRERRGARFPLWGAGAIVWTGGWWWLAWSRFDWFEAWQRFTFFPLWLGFIVTVNAWTEGRTGTCLMRRAPGTWLALFGASALFWWGFEWLNRFVRNWHYLGVQDFGPVAYAVHASVCFATVLPAVSAVAEWLESFGGWRRQMRRGPAWSAWERRGVAVGLLVGGGLALVLTGARPKLFYPALWLAPLALLSSERVLTNRPRGVVADVARGDWTRAGSWMAAALICGFFWEMWNWRSAAKWIYTVPGVDRWHVFEMPLLGYAGYLPFGLECLLVVERLRDRYQPR